jgi:ribonuclease J
VDGDNQRMDAIRVIALGGLGEVGKNMTVYEFGDNVMVVDSGLAFPRDEHLGVDLVLPDFGYLRDKRVRGIVLTHAHEDHVGSLPYVLRDIKVEQVWATRLTLGLVKSKLDEHGLLHSTDLREIDPDRSEQIGPFKVSFVRMAHSVPDNVAVMTETSAGRIVQTSDYKLDHTPVDGVRTDVGRLAEIGNLGVDLLLGDSTNAERPGFTPSERVVGEAFRQIIPLRRGRVLVSSFASNVHRMQQAVDVAVQCGRKVAIVGRSMRKNANIARNLGYMDVPEGVVLRPQELEELPPDQQLILCTGSQGEPMSALTRIAYNDHPAIRVESGDTVIISAKPVPGNELRVHDAINRLARNGAEVLHQEIAPVHVSGHACEEEIRTILGLIRPRAVMPVHGEFRMLAAHARLARDAGVPANSIVIAENGSVVEVSRDGVRIVDQIDSGVMFVDGLSVGDLSDVALRDRRRLSEDGVLIIVATVNGKGADAEPELIARGFPESEPVLAETREEAARVLRELVGADIQEIKLLQEHLHDAVGQLIYDRTGRRPMILPVVVEV